MDVNFEKFDGLIQRELILYREKSALLFDYLKEQSKSGFTSSQYLLYRSNYFFRTQATIPSVCLVLKSAAQHEDETTLKSAGQNLIEELGLNKNGGKSHAELLRFSHNKHGKFVFNISPSSLTESLHSELILEETKTFRRIQHKLYSSKTHIKVLAASYAQEEAATQMLATFLNSFFKPYRRLYSEIDFDELTEYFSCHLDGLEERHAEDAKRSLFNQCNTNVDVFASINTIAQILDAQSNMWVALQEALKVLENKNEITLIHE